MANGRHRVLRRIRCVVLSYEHVGLRRHPLTDILIVALGADGAQLLRLLAHVLGDHDALREVLRLVVVEGLVAIVGVQCLLLMLLLFGCKRMSSRLLYMLLHELLLIELCSSSSACLINRLAANGADLDRLGGLGSRLRL